jgi:hypothetical protein
MEVIRLATPQSPRRFAGYSAALTFLLASWLVEPARAQESTRALRLASGQETGNYYRLGRAIRERALGHNLDVTVLPTGGSLDNVKLLESGQVDFALVQSDIALRALKGHKPFDSPVEHLRLVTPLSTEAVQILVRSDLYIFTTAELRGKIVSLGPQGSGTEITARAILEASGVGVEETKTKHSPTDKVNGELKEEEIDAAFLSSSIPTPAIEQALHDREARLLVLESRVIERLASSGSYFETVIPKHTYSNQTEELPTIGVQALVLTRDSIDPTLVVLLLETLKSGRKEIESSAGVHMDLLGILPATQTFPLHERSRTLLRSGGNSQTFVLITIAGVFVGCVIVFIKQRHIRRSMAGHGELLLGGLTLMIVWLLSSAGLYYFERNFNENFANFPKAVWSMLVYVSGGFQSRSPVTRGGEVVSVIAIVVGMGVVAWFTAQLAGHFVTAKLEGLENFLLGRNRVPANLKDHIVVINWDHRIESMVEQLHGPDFEHKKRIMVISEDKTNFPSRPEFESCILLIGSPTDKRVLADARIQQAHSVTILSSWPNLDAAERRKTLDPDAADARTVLTILAIRTLSPQPSANSPLPITAEIRCSKNFDAAESAGRGGPTEIVCVEKFGANLLTQCALTPGLVSLYDDLLSFAPGTDEIYKIPLPNSCIGMSFTQLIHHFAARRSCKGHAVIPIGISRSNKVHLNPGETDSGIGSLRDGDALFVISDHEHSHTD